MPRVFTADEKGTIVDCSFWLGQSVRDGNVEQFVTRVTEVVCDTHDPLPRGHKPGGNLSVLRRANIHPLVSAALHEASLDRFPIVPDVLWARFLSYPVGGVRWRRAVAPFRERYEIMRALYGATGEGERIPRPTNLVARARLHRRHEEAENVRRHLVYFRRREAQEAQGGGAHRETIFVSASESESESDNGQDDDTADTADLEGWEAWVR
ncbi:hypothetical protein CC1G_12404 [Coprinopsis cinerea okayama7|uniref:Uncharacterized protein n=1 Tax=Coprinopsis cinerea (strain Okayama-7 / 130 / ATCC MYA-4618 / FGSC 9003) TaxID=240176 RepID=A8P361_COPC7|nr:hypothetical protein CC1G_12404 [Coprinopsis cinerea okayama7\|eukprot:XP_001838480.1 hypothetical protein CC1G_12404 [Coprinopsis cinerea okayama7\